MIPNASLAALPVLALVALAPLSGQQSQTEPHPGYDPTVQWDHSHEGPHGEALLRLEKALHCSCGCTLDAHLCQSQMQCGTSPVWSQRILALLEEGESDEVILAGFVSDFGTSVLMAPPLEGFNWVGYFLPWIAILGAAGVIGVVVGRGVRRTESIPTTRRVSPEEWDRIQQELDRMKEDEAGPTF